jgi:hypothetical protein
MKTPPTTARVNVAAPIRAAWPFGGPATAAAPAPVATPTPSPAGAGARYGGDYEILRRLQTELRHCGTSPTLTQWLSTLRQRLGEYCARPRPERLRREAAAIERAFIATAGLLELGYRERCSKPPGAP